MLLTSLLNVTITSVIFLAHSYTLYNSLEPPSTTPSYFFFSLRLKYPILSLVLSFSPPSCIPQKSFSSLRTHWGLHKPPWMQKNREAPPRTTTSHAELGCASVGLTNPPSPTCLPLAGYKLGGQGQDIFVEYFVSQTNFVHVQQSRQTGIWHCTQ